MENSNDEVIACFSCFSEWLVYIWDPVKVSVDTVKFDLCLLMSRLLHLILSTRSVVLSGIIILIIKIEATKRN